MSGDSHRIAVIGAGISGLCAAKRFLDVGAGEVTVFEAADRVGGVIGALRQDGYMCESAATGFLGNAPGGAWALCRELNVEVVEASREAKRRWIYLRDGLRALPAGPRQLLTTDVLSWRAKARLAAESLQVKSPPGVDETIAAFARRRFGDEVLHAVIEPFTIGIYAGDVEQLSLAAALPKLAELERRGGMLVGAISRAAEGLVSRVQTRSKKRDEATGTSRLWSPTRGMSAIVDALTARVGHRVRTNCPVAAIGREGKQIAVVLGEGSRELFDAAVLSVPAPVAAGLLAELSPELSAELQQISYAPLAIVHLGYDRVAIPHELDGFGFLVAAGEPLRTLGCVFESVLWPERAPAGSVLLRSIFGGTRDPSAVQASDDELVAMAHADLVRAVGAAAKPRFTNVVRWPRAVAQYNVGHLARVERAEDLAASVGIALSGASYRGVSVNDCVSAGHRIADEVLSRLSTMATVLLVALAVGGLAACSGGGAPSSLGGGDGGLTGTRTTGAGRSRTSPRANSGASVRRGNGTISLTVEWKTPPAALVSSPGMTACGTALRQPLQVDATGGVKAAAVWLTTDSDLPASDLAAAPIRAANCRVEPRMSVGSTLSVVSTDERPQQVSLAMVDSLDGKPDAIPSASSPLAEVRLAVVGQRFDVPLTTAGIVRVSLGERTDPGYVVVPSSAHVALTNDRGVALLRDVPPGGHEIVVWHRPLGADGKAIVARAAVNVVAGETTRETVLLSPR